MTVTEHVTVCIKAFERPDCLRRAVASVRRFYPDVRIIVADDSAEPLFLPDVQTLVLPFDTGLSFGRNRLVEAVETPFFFLLDDDSYFSEDTDLDAMLALIERTEIDILGSIVQDIPKGNLLPAGYMIFIRGEYGYSELGSYREIEGARVCDFVENAFMARTKTLQAFEGWDDNLKIHEHGDYFLRARGKLLVAQFLHSVTCHNHLTNGHYTTFRRGERSKMFSTMFFEKYGVIAWRSDVMGVPQWVKDRERQKCKSSSTA